MLVASWIAALAVVAWLVVTSRDVALERNRRATTAFAAVVEQQVERTIQASYLTLGAVRDALLLSRPREPNDSALRDMMRRRLEEVPFLRALFVIGSDGWIVHDTDFPATPRVSLADRPYFRAYLSKASPGHAIWPPVLSRSGTGWFLPVTRDVGGSDGFEGIVVAALQASHFEQRFREMELPEGYVVSVLYNDGTLVATHPPHTGEVGRNYGGRLAGLGPVPAAGPATFWTTNGLVPGRRLVTVRPLKTAPMVVRVSRGEDEVLGGWYRTAMPAILAMAVLTGVAAWFVVHLFRESARLARDRDRMLHSEKMEALGRLSGGMAHDFANLLSIVGMNAAILRKAPVDRTDIRNGALDAIERSIATGRQISKRLLTFARRRTLELTRLRLDEWIETSEPLFRQVVGSGVSVEASSERPLPEVLCDAAELDVTLVNLLANARDAMEGTGNVSVRVFRCRDPEQAPKPVEAASPPFVCITVRDDGPGMEEPVRRSAFEPFFSTKGDSGTGLGLAQVHGFMQQLGGHAILESSPGKGTAVHLLFPVAPPHADGDLPAPDDHVPGETRRTSG